MIFILLKIKSLFLLIIGAVRRAFCCFRARRKPYNDDNDECLTHVGVVPNREEGTMNWNENWGEDINRKPQTIQDHIQLYREKVAQTNVPQNNPSDEILDNLFQEMTPQYIKQKRILIGKNDNKSRNNAPDLSRLAVSSDTGLNDLGEWIEESTSGWDEQHIDPNDIFKEQRRIKRENKHAHTGLGRKLKT